VSLFGKKKETVTGPGPAAGHPYRESSEIIPQPLEPSLPRVVVADMSRRIVRTEHAIIIEELQEVKDGLGRVTKIWTSVWSTPSKKEQERREEEVRAGGGLWYGEIRSLPPHLALWMLDQIEALQRLAYATLTH
jgi:hypothetical protein